MLCRYVWLPLLVHNNTDGQSESDQAPVKLELRWQDTWSWSDLTRYAAAPNAADVSFFTLQHLCAVQH